jgi:hypothetical protein
MIVSSAEAVDEHGLVVGDDVYGRAWRSRHGSAGEQRKVVSTILDLGKASLSRQIAEFLEWSGDQYAVLALIRAVRDVADPADMKRWRNIKGGFRGGWDAETLKELEQSFQAACTPASPPRLASTRPSTSSDRADKPPAVAVQTEETDQVTIWATVCVCTGAVGLLVVYLVYRFKYRRPLRAGHSSGNAMSVGANRRGVQGSRR